MQSFDAAEKDCNSALKIDKRMTKALFRCCFSYMIISCMKVMSHGLLSSGVAKRALLSAIEPEPLRTSRKY